MWELQKTSTHPPPFILVAIDKLDFVWSLLLGVESICRKVP